jgi:hypothetical protein
LVLLDHHFDLDPTTIWSEFPDAPAPPPLLAAGYGLSAPPSYDEFPPGAETPDFVEVIFYPSYESETGFSWPGPDPLHHGTSADDIFLYASAFLLLEQVHWLELRLCGLNEVNEVTEQFLFFVPRFETVLGNLNRVKGQIHDVITRQGHGPSKRRYQLHIYPWQESGFIMATRSAVPILNNHPTLAVSILDPQFFVQNIVGGFVKSD